MEPITSKTHFRVSFDRSVYWITGGISLLFAMIVAGQVASYFKGGHFVSLLTSFVLVVIYLFSFLLRITGYDLSEESIVIRRPLKPRIIARRNIQAVEWLPREAVGSSVRIFGNGGLFGYYGKFANRKIGGMTWYATRRNNIVLLRLVNGEKIVITPDDPGRLQQALEREKGNGVPLSNVDAL